MAGTLIMTFRKARRRQSSVGWTIVASESSATSGVHSKDTNPSARRWTREPGPVPRRHDECLPGPARGTDRAARVTGVEQIAVVVVPVGSGDRFGEDRRVRGGASHALGSTSRANSPLSSNPERGCRARSRRPRRGVAAGHGSSCCPQYDLSIARRARRETQTRHQDIVAALT